MMTEDALKCAQYRYKKHPQERIFQQDIIKILKRAMQSRQGKKQAGNVGKSIFSKHQCATAMLSAKRLL
ncbi:MAG: hypothetical protein ACX93T_04120 [Bacteroidota bacterium]